jgi:hypothetical protein
MMIKLSHNEIWYWHLRIEEFNATDLKPKEFCDKYDVEHKKFGNMRYRIEYKSKTNPELYVKQAAIARKYMASGQSISKFAKEHKIDLRILSELNTHLGYVDIIEKLKQNPPSHRYEPESQDKTEKRMNFIQVPTRLPERVPDPPAPSLENKNDIELIISKGVKVIVAPEVSSEKLIKIIELLKEL